VSDVNSVLNDVVFLSMVFMKGKYVTSRRISSTGELESYVSKTLGSGTYIMSARFDLDGKEANLRILTANGRIVAASLDVSGERRFGLEAVEEALRRTQNLVLNVFELTDELINMFPQLREAVERARSGAPAIETRRSTAPPAPAAAAPAATTTPAAPPRTPPAAAPPTPPRAPAPTPAADAGDRMRDAGIRDRVREELVVPRLRRRTYTPPPIIPMSTPPRTTTTSTPARPLALSEDLASLEEEVVRAFRELAIAVERVEISIEEGVSMDVYVKFRDMPPRELDAEKLAWIAVSRLYEVAKNLVDRYGLALTIELPHTGAHRFHFVTNVDKILALFHGVVFRVLFSHGAVITGIKSRVSSDESFVEVIYSVRPKSREVLLSTDMLNRLAQECLRKIKNVWDRRARIRLKAGFFTEGRAEG